MFTLVEVIAALHVEAGNPNSCVYYKSSCIYKNEKHLQLYISFSKQVSCKHTVDAYNHAFPLAKKDAYVYKR